MGAWGYNPLQNDSALNELEKLFEESRLVERVRQSLQQDLVECADEIRATALLVYELSNSDLWPCDSWREIVSLASQRLAELLRSDIYGNPGFVASLQTQIGKLQGLDGRANCTSDADGLELRPPN